MNDRNFRPSRGVRRVPPTGVHVATPNCVDDDRGVPHGHVCQPHRRAGDPTGSHSPAEASGQIEPSADTNGHTDPAPLRGELVDKWEPARPSRDADLWSVQLQSPPPQRALDETYIARIPHDVQPECASAGQPAGLDEADVPIPVTLWSDMTLDSDPMQNQVTRIVVENC